MGRQGHVYVYPVGLSVFDVESVKEDTVTLIVKNVQSR